MSEWRNFHSTDELDRELAQHIAGQLSAAIDTHGAASLAVSGGGTPRQMFQQLSRHELEWSKVWITLVDERWVATDSQDSNEQLVRHNLLQNRAAAAHFVGLKSEHADARDAVLTVSTRLEQIARPFTVVVLGMGGDGHTASWFPQATNLQALLDQDSAQIVAATQPVTAPHQRMTLTLCAALNTRSLIIHITGTAKKAVLESARENRYPIAAVLEQNTTAATIWWAP
ncbi:MAG: 6-phosphogluconolactonase [Gammaproteobacteria bacterium]|jgi:6-phosphogluconolactonase|nr:6-phosphogluconolactonase [Gammaproteobacteria bacterium]